MRVYVVKDGIHTLTGGVPSHYSADYERFSKRYLAVFSSAVIVGRLFNREDLGARPIIGPGVTFLAAPGFQGPRQFFKKIGSVARFVLSLARPGDAFILRIPATLPSILGLVLCLKRIPFGVELVGDPADAYSRGVLQHPMSVLWKFLFVRVTKFLCRRAVANAYVTKKALQIGYPPRDPEKSFSFTSLELRGDMIVNHPRIFQGGAETLSLVSVGMMHNSVKGIDLILKAVKACRDAGLAVNFSVIGDGRLRSCYEVMAAQLGISEFVKFFGRLDSFADIATVLSGADLFVLASRQEGLPRVLIEAMAQGLPCIATRVGGVGELLNDECIFEVDDLSSLIQLIEERYRDRDILTAASARNLSVVNLYRDSLVSIERARFYSSVLAACSRNMKSGV